METLVSPGLIGLTIFHTVRAENRNAIVPRRFIMHLTSRANLNTTVQNENEDTDARETMTCVAGLIKVTRMCVHRIFPFNRKEDRGKVVVSKSRDRDHINRGITSERSGTSNELSGSASNSR
ncbi:hypothetical protein X777_13396 [Ooceraea biroi]|uniref:Uncharacterized protein n=1 Tax=Ooceraea biroi TaxID=2015173 RepID=A0A026WW94_OOCBI|nr:hypothetical protein X777_13396 [Ooceraea biroi]